MVLIAIILTRLIPVVPLQYSKLRLRINHHRLLALCHISALTTLPGICAVQNVNDDLANEGITLRFILQLCLAGLALFILVSS